MQPGPTLTSWRVVAYFRMPFSSTKYLWEQRGMIVAGGKGWAETSPCSPPIWGLKSPQGWARHPGPAGCWLLVLALPVTLCQPFRGHFLFLSKYPSCRCGSWPGLPRVRGSSTTSQLSEPCGDRGQHWGPSALGCSPPCPQSGTPRGWVISVSPFLKWGEAPQGLMVPLCTTRILLSPPPPQAQSPPTC